jgi:hypothetical protein
MSQARIAALEAQIAELQSRLDGMTTGDAEPRPHDDGDGSSRRGLLRAAGAAAVGAAVGAVGLAARPAAAADPEDLDLGTDDNITAGLTGARSTANTPGAVAFVFQVASSYPNTGTTYPGALAGWSGSASMPNGVYGYTESSTPGAAAIVGFGGSAGSYGLLARGQRANARLLPLGSAPQTRSDAHELGELVVDVSGDMWLCTEAGTPGAWRKISGAAAAGAYHAISPVRVYDSRVATPLKGALASGANRTVSVADGRDLVTGAVNAADVVPSGATAVFANVTIADTTSQGFLAINPGGTTTVSASSINWSASGQMLANGLALTLNANREVTVVAGGGGTTNFVIDVNGYYL